MTDNINQIKEQFRLPHVWDSWTPAVKPKQHPFPSFSGGKQAKTKGTQY